MKTLWHQVLFPYNRDLVEDHFDFCADRDCTTGYFSSSIRIPKSQMRVFQPGRQAMLCHCFDIAEAVYRAAMADGKAAAIKAFVIQQTKAGLCACEARNPSGRCCLAAFRQIEKAHDH